MFGLFAAEAAHEGPHIAIAPEALFTVGPFTITNSILFGWVAGLIIAGALVYAARRTKLKPMGGIVQFVEMGATFIMGILESNLGSHKKAVKYAPLFISIFFIVLLNNWLGLIPATGGEFLSLNGVPLFRAYTADLNATIAMAVSGVVIVQACAIREQGGGKHLMHYFGGNLKNPINLFVGILEMFGELTRVISLSLRLFLNVLIGEILISIFHHLGQLAAPITVLPFLAMEIFVGFVQAYIFTMLCITYLGIAISHAQHDDHQPADTGQHDGKLERFSHGVERVAGEWVQ